VRAANDTSRTALLAWLCCGLLPAATLAQATPFEVGSAMVGPTPVNVTFSRTYADPIVVCTPNYANNTRPIVVRVNNVQSTGFSAWLQNPGDAFTPATEQVCYIAMEAGAWEIDGVRFEAQRFKSTVTDNASSWVGQSKSYLQSYTKPVVIGQVMTAFDADWSVVWCRGSSSTSPPSSSTLYVGKHVGDDTDTTRANETIGFIVFEAGSGTVSGVAYDAFNSADQIQGIDNAPPDAAPFLGSYGAAPPVILASSIGMDGSDGGWPVLYGIPFASTADALLAIDEDQISDNERSHTTEQVAVMAFGGQPPLFVDVSADTGFDVQTTNDFHSGSGLHWGDLDNDGDLDAIITGNQSARLLRNINAGQAFAVSTFGGGNRPRQGTLIDIDNDDDLDFWHRDLTLFQNDGNANFTDTGNLGFNQPSNNEAVAGVDINADGWIDVVLFSENGNWIGHHQGDTPVALVGTNDPAFGFNDVGDGGNGDFVSAGDVDNDGHLDFFYHYNGGKLFISKGNGAYAEDDHGINVVTNNNDKIGSAWADYDNDGDIDLFVPRHTAGQPGYLWRNDGSSFTNVASAAGITDTSNQRAACWGDFDNDGDLDLYISVENGPNVLYENQGDGTFVAIDEGTAITGKGQGAVFVDFDNDGDLDLAHTREDATNVLLRNGTNNDNFLLVRLIGLGDGGTNRSANGIRIELRDAASTTYLARREIAVARGYGGAEPHWAHFGGVDPDSAYTLLVYFHSLPVDEPLSVSVTPANVSTTIGATTIPQMITIEEPPTRKRIIRWHEVINRSSS